MIVSGYQLDLYCDNIENDALHYHGFYDLASYHQFPLTYFADGRKCYSEVRRLARKAGWTLKRDGRVFCPKCSNLNKKNVS